MVTTKSINLALEFYIIYSELEIDETLKTSLNHHLKSIKYLIQWQGFRLISS